MPLKPGLLTSELWLLIATVANADTGALTDKQTLNLATLGLAALYLVARTLLKTLQVRQGWPPARSGRAAAPAPAAPPSDPVQPPPAAV